MNLTISKSLNSNARRLFSAKENRKTQMTNHQKTNSGITNEIKSAKDYLYVVPNTFSQQYFNN